MLDDFLRAKPCKVHRVRGVVVNQARPCVMCPEAGCESIGPDAETVGEAVVRWNASDLTEGSPDA